MNNSMLISVVVPCFNVESFIEECLLSLLNQTYDNIEIICVDNNSSDSTYETIVNFKKEFPQLDLILTRESVPGASAARNKGLSMAKGGWIQFLDADDLLLPDKISHQIELVNNYSKIDFVAGAYQRLNIYGNKQLFTPGCGDPWISLPKVRLGCTCSNIFKKESLLAVSGWDVALKSSQEYDLMFRLLKNKAVVYFDNLPLTVVRDRESGSITQSDVLGNSTRRLYHLSSINNYLLSNSFDVKYRRVAEQCMFEEIRRIYKVEPRLAEKYYDSIFSIKPSIRASESTSRLYSFCFKFLPFRQVQVINKCFQKIKF